MPRICSTQVFLDPDAVLMGKGAALQGSERREPQERRHAVKTACPSAHHQHLRPQADTGMMTRSKGRERMAERTRGEVYAQRHQEASHEAWTWESSQWNEWSWRDWQSTTQESARSTSRGTRARSSLRHLANVASHGRPWLGGSRCGGPALDRPPPPPTRHAHEER